MLQKSVDPAKVFFRQQILCGTLAGNPCPLVTITACPASGGWKDMHQLREYKRQHWIWLAPEVAASRDLVDKTSTEDKGPVISAL